MLVSLVVFALTASLPQWALTDASAIRAQPVNGGVRITASVAIDACREADIIAYSGGIPTEYQIVARTKPEDIGKMCVRPTGPITVSRWFPIKGPNVTVRTLKFATNVPVNP